MGILENINGHDDLMRLTNAERVQLCAEIRAFLVSSVSKTGGHLASNLGTVELSVAIETVFNTMKDRLVFDVGHQSYVHKLLTGRQADFEHLRQFGGISGFPKPQESKADAFVAGHASSSVSIALGMARARTLLGQDYNVVALIGDGAITGGMAYEGFNDASASGESMVIILNDNEMSIDRSVGGMAGHLSKIRSGAKYIRLKNGYRALMRRLPGGIGFYKFTSRIKNRIKRMLLPSTLFENMGLTYLGPIDGHDLPNLISVLRVARDMKCPVVVHVMTKKGKGYSHAEQEPEKFHGISKFNPETGKKLSKKGKTYSDSFGDTMMELASKDPRVCAITAAMPGGTGLLKFRETFPERTFDVGIAEEHAVSMAGGLAKQGMIPVVALYSTFLQRSYDQIMQDVGLLKLHVVFAVDRAGLVGEDGPTHHGVFDVGFLRQVPGMLVLCPATMDEQREMLRWAVEDYDGPVAVRYPRGGSAEDGSRFQGDPSRIVCQAQGDAVTLITYGSVTGEVTKACDALRDAGVSAQVLRLLSVSHYSEEQLVSMIRGRHVFVIEEACTGSGIKEAIAWSLSRSGSDCRIHGIDLGPEFVPHGDLMSLYRLAGMDHDSIYKTVCEVLRHEN